MTAESTATTHTININFEAISEAAISALPFLLARWLPGGKRIGRARANWPRRSSRLRVWRAAA